MTCAHVSARVVTHVTPVPRAPLNYSQEDIHALASQAELLVLTRGGSSSDLRRGSSRSAETQLRRPAAQTIMTLKQ